MGDTEQIPREVVFSTAATEAAGFYKFIITVASSFLGGTLLFLERVVPHPTSLGVALLGLGWLFLIASIAAVAWIRRLNLESAQRALAGKYNDARKFDRQGRRFSVAATLCLAGGMLLVAACGLVSLWNVASKGVQQ
jgi:hypothetical protein